MEIVKQEAKAKTDKCKLCVKDNTTAHDDTLKISVNPNVKT